MRQRPQMDKRKEGKRTRRADRSQAPPAAAAAKSDANAAATTMGEYEDA